MAVHSELCRARRALVVALAALLGACGCSGSTGPTRVMGDVTFDGKPVSRGTITFIPVEDTPGPSTGDSIEDGHYDIPAKKGPLVGGTYRVEITALAKTGKTRPDPIKPKGPPVDVMKQYIPPVYNKKSTLRVTPKAGTNRFDFALEPQESRGKNSTP